MRDADDVAESDVAKDMSKPRDVHRDRSMSKNQGEDEEESVHRDERSGSNGSIRSNKEKHFEDNSKLQASNIKIDILKQSLLNLESKVKDLRDTRQRKNHNVFETQQKLNTELLSIVKKHADKGELKEDDIAVAVEEQIKHQPNSLTKDNIKLREENDKLRELLLQKNREIEQLHYSNGDLKRSRDQGITRIQELCKIIETKQHNEEQHLKLTNKPNHQKHPASKSQSVAYNNTAYQA